MYSLPLPHFVVLVVVCVYSIVRYPRLSKRVRPTFFSFRGAASVCVFLLCAEADNIGEYCRNWKCTTTSYLYICCLPQREQKRNCNALPGKQCVEFANVEIIL